MHDTSATAGTLYLVATPIGNREDITLRAVKTLQAVDVILAEDTRHSRPLLTGLGIQKPLSSFHAHNEHKKSESILLSLLQGKSYALISDAGTPLISDPGFSLVKLAREQGIAVVPIPGPCALITALSAAGIPCEVFTFGGFLPAKSAARLKTLKQLSQLNHTVIFYESTHRIVETLNAVTVLFGEDCPVVLAKELTKAFERFITGTAREIQHWLSADAQLSKGEFVLMIPPRPMLSETHPDEAILSVLLHELPLKQAVNLTAKITGCNKNTLYKMALALQPT